MTASSDSRHPDVTPEQRAFVRLAAILWLLNFVFLFVGDGITIIGRMGSSFEETARWATQSIVLYRVALLNVAVDWFVTALLAFALYVALEPVNRRLAQLALVLRAGSSFVGAASLMFRMTQAQLYTSSATPDLFTTEQLRALVTAITRGSAGVEVAWIFQGAGMTLFYLLFLRARWLPGWLARVGVVTSALQVVVSGVMFVYPEWIRPLKLVLLPGLFTEIATAVWLLVRGLPRRATTDAMGRPTAT